MGKVQIITEARNLIAKTIQYEHGFVTFAENGIAEVEKEIADKLLATENNIKLFVENVKEDIKEEVDKFIQTETDEAKIDVSKIEKFEQEVKDKIGEAASYAEELIAMTVAELKALAKEAGILEDEIKGLKKDELVAKIISKI